MIHRATAGCKPLVRRLEKMQQEAHLRVDEVAHVNGKPPAGLAIKMRVAEAVASAVNGIRDRIC